MHEEWKDRIRTGGLVRRLDQNAHGELVDRNGEPTEMTQSQLKAAELLLKRTWPEVRHHQGELKLRKLTVRLAPSSSDN